MPVTTEFSPCKNLKKRLETQFWTNQCSESKSRTTKTQGRPRNPWTACIGKPVTSFREKEGVLAFFVYAQSNVTNRDRNDHGRICIRFFFSLCRLKCSNKSHEIDDLYYMTSYFATDCR